MTPFSLAMVSIVSNRILLNMRSVRGGASHHSLAKGSGGGPARSRHEQAASHFPGTVSIAPVPPVHHPQYPDSDFAKASSKDSEYEMDKMMV